MKKYFSKTIFLPSWRQIEKTKWSILNFSKVDWDINTKFSPVVNLYENPLCTENQGHRCSKFGFPAKNAKNFSWVWRGQFLSYTLQIWWEIIFFIVIKVLKFWWGNLKWFWIWQNQWGVSCPFLQMSLTKQAIQWTNLSPYNPSFMSTCQRCIPNRFNH